MKCRPTIAIHGGAGHWRGKEALDKMIEYMNESLLRGMEALLATNALEGVIKAVMVLEDSGEFNAGVGSVPNSEGELEMDAGVMDGFLGDAGAVASVRNVKNPVLLAYYVMKKTNHVLVVGEGAERLAERFGLERIPKRDIVKRDPVLSRRFWAIGGRPFGDTVGAVAIDSECRLAAASSTGGIAGKLKGRVGDTPIPGSGFYANESTAVVATGIGEIIMLNALSKRVADLWASTRRIDLAISLVISEVTKKYGGDNVGLLGLDINGNVHAEYNTQAMPWGFYKLGGEPAISGLPRSRS